MPLHRSRTDSCVKTNSAQHRSGHMFLLIIAASWPTQPMQAICPLNGMQCIFTVETRSHTIYLYMNTSTTHQRYNSIGIATCEYVRKLLLTRDNRGYNHKQLIEQSQSTTADPANYWAYHINACPSLTAFLFIESVDTKWHSVQEICLKIIMHRTIKT